MASSLGIYPIFRQTHISSSSFVAAEKLGNREYLNILEHSNFKTSDQMKLSETLSYCIGKSSEAQINRRPASTDTGSGSVVPATVWDGMDQYDSAHLQLLGIWKIEDLQDGWKFLKIGICGKSTTVGQLHSLWNKLFVACCGIFRTWILRHPKISCFKAPFFRSRGLAQPRVKQCHSERFSIHLGIIHRPSSWVNFFNT